MMTKGVSEIMRVCVSSVRVLRAALDSGIPLTEDRRDSLSRALLVIEEELIDLLKRHEAFKWIDGAIMNEAARTALEAAVQEANTMRRERDEARRERDYLRLSLDGTQNEG